MEEGFQIFFKKIPQLLLVIRFLKMISTRLKQSVVLSELKRREIVPQEESIPKLRRTRNIEIYNTWTEKWNEVYTPITLGDLKKILKLKGNYAINVVSDDRTKTYLNDNELIFFRKEDIYNYYLNTDNNEETKADV
jgi:hypothetical protein